MKTTRTATETRNNRFQACEVQTRRNGHAVWYWQVIDAATDGLCGFGDQRHCIALAKRLEAESIADRDAA